MAEKSIEKRRIRERELGKDMQIPSEIIDSLRLFAIEKRLNAAQVKAIFNEEISEKIAVPENSVPIEIFKNKKLGALEAIVKYLKEEKGWTFAKTAAITGRSGKTICNFDHKARGVVPLQEILNQSLNLGVTFVADKTGHAVFTKYMKLFGLGEKTGVDVPNDDTWRRDRTGCELCSGVFRSGNFSLTH